MKKILARSQAKWRAAYFWSGEEARVKWHPPRKFASPSDGRVSKDRNELHCCRGRRFPRRSLAFLCPGWPSHDDRAQTRPGCWMRSVHPPKHDHTPPRSSRPPSPPVGIARELYGWDDKDGRSLLFLYPTFLVCPARLNRSFPPNAQGAVLEPKG